jgi:tRNA uridine 5-carbamoylmethylation protein Kti12
VSHRSELTVPNGADGFSPTIVEDPDNTNEIYKLDITTKESTIVTPNLIGGIDSISVNGVAQTISNKAVNLDVASNLITEDQWTQIQALLV